MGQLASDDFNRGDGGLGANWATETGTSAPAIASFQVTGGGGDSVGLYTATTPPADQYSELTAVSIAAGDNGGPVVRAASGSETAYQFNIVGGASGLGTANTHSIYRIDAGSYTEIANASFVVHAGDVVRLEVSGAGATVSLVGKVNGSAVITTSDTTGSRITAANNWGVLVSGVTGTAFDNWAGGDLTGSSNLSVGLGAIGEPVVGGSTF